MPPIFKSLIRIVSHLAFSSSVPSSPISRITSVMYKQVPTKVFSVEIFLFHMGFSEHKSICSVHANTDNLHIHVIVDRVSNDLRDGKSFIPLATGTVVKPNKNDNRLKRHDTLCQHAAQFDICQKYGWSTERCLVDNLGNKLKNIKPKLAKNTISEELRTGKKSEQRICKEILEATKPPTTSAEAKEIFTDLKQRGITYSFRKNTKGENIGLLYHYKNKRIGSSRISEKGTAWHFDAITPLLLATPPPQAQKPLTPPTPKNIVKNDLGLLYKTIQHSINNDRNYNNLHESLKREGYYLKESGGSYRVINTENKDISYKLSEISRKLTKKSLNKAFQENANKYEEILENSTNWEEMQFYQ